MKTDLTPDKRTTLLENMTIATWNVQGINQKITEVITEMKNRKIDILVVTETKKKMKGSEIKDGYVYIYSGVDQNRRAAAGVGILIRKELKARIIGYTWYNERLITVKIKSGRSHYYIIGAYAPNEGQTQETEEFYLELQNCINKAGKNDYVLIMGDLNARIGKETIPNLIGPHGEDKVNSNGKCLRDFCSYNNLRITNSYFKHKLIHKYTWEGRGKKSIIDYVIGNEKIWPYILDTRVYRGAEADTDHYLLCSKIRLPKKYIRKQKVNKKIEKERYKIQLLEQPSIKDLYKRRLDKYLGGRVGEINIDWEYIKVAINKAAGEVLGMQRKRGPRRMKIWDENLKEAIRLKKKTYLKWIDTKKIEDHIEYKRRRAIVRKLTRVYNNKGWEEFVKRLEYDITGAKKYGFKIFKNLRVEERDKAKLEVIPTEQWTSYYRELLTNNEDPYTNGMTNTNEWNAITMEELETAMEKLKNRRAPGTDGLNMELFKYGSQKLKRRLIQLFNDIWSLGYIPNDWKIAKIINIYKNGDRNNRGNYRGISLLNTAYKIYATIIKNKLQPYAEKVILEPQCGFRKGRSCIDAIFTLKQIMEKRKEFNLPIYLLFLDYEKAYDRVRRPILWNILEEYEIPKNLINAIKSMYDNTSITIEGDNKSKREIINQGLRQGCGLSPILFDLYINKILEEWQKNNVEGIDLGNKKYISTILFADDQILMADSEDKLQRNVHKLNNIIKKYNMKISGKKTKAGGSTIWQTARS